jgi:hypothetical protein
MTPAQKQTGPQLGATHWIKNHWELKSERSFHLQAQALLLNELAAIVRRRQFEKCCTKLDSFLRLFPYHRKGRRVSVKA